MLRINKLFDNITFMGRICMKIESADQLFDSFDPAPVERRSVKQDVDVYLIEKLNNISFRKKILLELSIPKDFPYSEEQIEKALKNHFSKRAHFRFRKMTKETVRRLLDLLFGVLFLVVCLFSSHYFHINAHNYSFFKVLGESLSIIGWVVIWEPVSYFLYQKRDALKDAYKYSRLANAKIKILRMA